jgi:hypothetical protein
MMTVSPRWHLISAFAVFSVCGCASAKVSPVGTIRPLGHSISRVALAPSGGVLADAVGVAMLNLGFDVIDTQQTSNWMVRANLDEFELIKPENLSKLGEQGIDAILIVRTAAGYDGKPQSASVRVISTKNSSLIAGASWQNGHGGAQGSPADGHMRKDVVEAAQQIASALSTQLHRK